VLVAVELMIGMIALRCLIALVAWFRSRRIEQAASRTLVAASSPSPAGRQATSAAQP
jgi:hypothetical protein